MKTAWGWIVMGSALAAAAGCGTKHSAAPKGGDEYVSSGAGGVGSGPTGTGGQQPADNPAGDVPGPQGTGN